jgi:hypothetical protein
VHVTAVKKGAYEEQISEGGRGEIELEQFANQQIQQHRNVIDITLAGELQEVLMLR